MHGAITGNEGNGQEEVDRDVRAVVDFWFDEIGSESWFKGDAAIDGAIRERFAGLHLDLAGGVTQAWRASPEHRLAAVIVLDQFPRNIYRSTPLAFATDALALNEARTAIALGADRAVDRERAWFFYMPFEHSEVLAEQVRALALFKAHGDRELLRYAQAHHDVIAQFGRFPHRNAILGRISTEAELAYLATHGSGF